MRNSVPTNVHRVARRFSGWQLLLGMFVLALAISVAIQLAARSPRAADSVVPAIPIGVATPVEPVFGTEPAPLLPVADEAEVPTPKGDDSAIPSGEPPLTGIHVFPPLGTRPLLTGVVVPEEFELPPGYVRHYQTTDDGMRLAPILMYHPRRPPVDATGQQIPVTPDRVVPAEMAPPGMPIEMLELPKADPKSSSARDLIGRS